MQEKHFTIMTALFALATLLVGCVSLTLVPGYEWPFAPFAADAHPSEQLVLGLMLGQVCAATAWLARCQGNSLVRFLGAVSVVYVWSHAVSANLLDASCWAAVLLLCGTASWACHMACLALLEFQANRTAKDRSRWQYSLADMMQWTTGVAILMGICRVVDLRTGIAWLGLPTALLIACSLAITTRAIVASRADLGFVGSMLLVASLFGAAGTPVSQTLVFTATSTALFYAVVLKVSLATGDRLPVLPAIRARSASE